MRILIISLAYLPFIGGAELAVKEITKRINGVTFDMITANLDGKQSDVQRIENITVHRICKGAMGKYIFPYVAYKKACSLHKEHSYDAVWAIMANQAGIAATMFKKKNKNIKYILTLQEGDSVLKIWTRTFFIRPLYRAIYKRADVVQAISNYLSERARKLAPEKKIVVVPNGVDLQNFQKSYDDTVLYEKKKSLGINQEDKVVVTASRLVSKNGVDTLIKAMKNVDAKLLIAGSGKQITKLKSLCQEIDVRNKIIFAGHVNHSELPLFLRISDVFARPSRSEGLGSAFLEAMSCSLPIVATNVGGIPDFLEDGKTGLFCLVNNPKDVADKINILLIDDEFRKEIATNGKKLIEQKYNWEIVAQRFLVEVMQN